MIYLFPPSRFARIPIKTKKEREATLRATGERVARSIAALEAKREEAIEWALKRVSEMLTQCHRRPPM
jgi:hypothetical protein